MLLFVKFELKKKAKTDIKRHKNSLKKSTKKTDRVYIIPGRDRGLE